MPELSTVIRLVQRLEDSRSRLEKAEKQLSIFESRLGEMNRQKTQLEEQILARREDIRRDLILLQREMQKVPLSPTSTSSGDSSGNSE